MLFYLSIMALTLATLGSVRLYQKQVRQRLDQPSAKPALNPGQVHGPHDGTRAEANEGQTQERTIDTLRVGDVVIELENDWLLIQTKAYLEEEERWSVHTLENGVAQRLLEVRKEDRWTAAFLQEVHDLPVFGQLLDGLTYQNISYQIRCRGDARVRILPDRAQTESVIQYARYHGSDGSILIIEDHEGEKAVYLAQQVSPHQLSFLPGAPLESDESLDLPS